VSAVVLHKTPGAAGVPGVGGWDCPACSEALTDRETHSCAMKRVP
jgi:hypothetical protein